MRAAGWTAATVVLAASGAGLIPLAGGADASELSQERAAAVAGVVGAGAVVPRAAVSRVIGWPSRPASARVGGEIAAPIVVSPGGGRTVVVQYQRAGTRRWLAQSVARTSSRGALLSRFRPPGSGTWRVRLAVAGSTAAAGVVTAPRVVVAAGVAVVTTVAGWSGTAPRVAVGQSTGVTVRVAPGVARRVVVQARAPGATAFHGVSTVMTRASGRATVSLRPTRAGSWWYRLVVEASPYARATATAARVLVAVAVTAPTPAPTPTPVDPSPPPTPVSPSSWQADMLARINQLRASVGAAPLTLCVALGSAAQAFATDMAGRDYFGHTSPEGTDPGDRIAAAGYVGGWGENIAAGYPDVARVMAGWIASPGHYANLVRTSFTHVGLGRATGTGSTYGTYWVQDFGSGQARPPATC